MVPVTGNTPLCPLRRIPQVRPRGQFEDRGYFKNAIGACSHEEQAPILPVDGRPCVLQVQSSAHNLTTHNNPFQQVSGAALMLASGCPQLAGFQFSVNRAPGIDENGIRALVVPADLIPVHPIPPERVPYHLKRRGRLEWSADPHPQEFPILHIFAGIVATPRARAAPQFDGECRSGDSRSPPVRKCRRSEERAVQRALLGLLPQFRAPGLPGQPVSEVGARSPASCGEQPSSH